MRPSTACHICRSRRRRCTSRGPLEACEFCAERGIPCSFTFIAYNPQSNSVQLEVATGGAQLALPPPEVCEDLIGLYFQYIHDTSQWLFHRPTMIEDFRAGILPRAVLLAVFSLSARFCTHPYFQTIEPRKRGGVYAKEAESLLIVRDISLSTVQLCLILGAYFSTEGDAAAEAMYYGIACRAATVSGLSVEHASSKLAHELIVRTLWTLTMCDIWSSAGNNIPRMFPPEPRTYPMDEISFLHLNQDAIDYGSSSPLEAVRTSLLAEMFKVNSIFAEVTNIITATVIQCYSDQEYIAAAGPVASRLDDWYRDLHPRLKDTQDNLEYHCHSGTGHMFVALYLGYYHFAQLLCYKFLHNPHENSDSAISEFTARCKASSASLCDMLYRAYATQGAEVYYTMVGHVLVVSSTVQLHNLLFSLDDWDISAARNRLEKNYKILSELQLFWPTLDNSLIRFREFHQACKDAKESTFQMDQWMLRFLLAFSKPVKSKPTESWTVTWRELSLASPLLHHASPQIADASPMDIISISQSHGSCE